MYIFAITIYFMKQFLSTLFLPSSFIILIFCCKSAHAQTQNDSLNNQSKTLNEVIIQGNRIQIPFSKQNRNIIVIDKEIIKSLPVKSINEVLSYVAGVDVRQRGPWGTQADIGIDGGTFDQTLILINGIKIIDPQTGHNMMNIPISTMAIDRIEILKGAAARIYGINALNGAINIITRQPIKNEADIKLYFGTSFKRDTSNNNLYAANGLDFNVGFANKNIKQIISGSHSQSSGYRYNTSFKNNKIYYQNNINFGKHNSLAFSGGYINNDFGANAFYAAPGDIESKEIVQTTLANVSAVLQVNKSWILKPRLSYRYNYDDYIYVRQKPDVYRNQHKTNVFSAEINNSFYTSAGTFGLGLELRNENINSNSLGKRDRKNYGFFGEYSFNKIKNLLINAGAYANYNSDFGWQVLPGIDAGYEVYNNLRIFANAGSGQRIPTYTDLYYKSPANIGNENLIPEHSIYYESGIKYNTSLLNISISYFHRNTYDFIDWVKDSINQPWQPQNFQEIVTHGISADADYRFFSNKNTNFSLLAGLSYTWLNPQIKIEAGSSKISRYALDNFRNQITARATLDYKRKFNFTLVSKYQERVNYKNYFLMDAKISARLKPFEIFADLNNITDVTFIEAGAVPMVGRWVTAGCLFSFR